MSVPVVRLVTDEDEDFLEHLETVRGDVPPEPMEFDEETRLVVELDGQPVGMANVEDNELGIQVHDLAVLPEFRRRRIATGLLEYWQRRAVESQRLMLVFVPAHNELMRELCLALNFQPDWEDDSTAVYYWNLPQ